MSDYPPKGFERINVELFNNRTVIVTYANASGQSIRRFERLDRNKYNADGSLR